MRTRTRRQWQATTLLVLMAGCNQDQVVNVPKAVPKVAAYVAGAAASALQPNGQFIADRSESPDGMPIITEARARQLAMAYIRSYARSFHAAWERQHGAPI